MHFKQAFSFRLYNRHRNKGCNLCGCPERSLLEAYKSDPDCEYTRAAGRKGLVRFYRDGREDVYWDGRVETKFRSWKRHSKCRHQWEKHTVPVILNYGQVSRYDFGADHYRKWVLECLRKKGTCYFDLHHNDFLEEVLFELGQKGIIELDFPSIQIFKAPLLPQEPGTPKPKASVGKKHRSGRNVNKAKARARRKERREVVEAVAENTRWRRRADKDGLASPPRPDQLEPCRPWKSTAPSTPLEKLIAKAKEDNIKGVLRKNASCLQLLDNFSNYSDTNLGPTIPYGHDFRKYPGPLEQCVVWLTGRCLGEIPPWALASMTSNPSYGAHNTARSKPFWEWLLGITPFRAHFPLTKNECKELFHLPAIVKYENQAIAAAIARAHHCDWETTKNLAWTAVLPLPFGQRVGLDLADTRQLNFLRKMAEWIHTLPVPPSRSELRDLMDFVCRSHLYADGDFSFKGRTLKSFQVLMNKWHEDLAERVGLISESSRYPYRPPATWSAHDYTYEMGTSYRFRELLSETELYKEGKEQHNCVRSYSHDCISGRSSIVAMRGICSCERVTLEINNRTRRIVQIREVCNKRPTDEEMRIIRQYASAKNLTIASYAW